jgi:hypothetical protein
MTGHTGLFVVLADRLDAGQGYTIDEGIKLVRQDTDRPLYGMFVDGDCINVFDASAGNETATLGYKIRAAAAQYRSEEETDGEDIVDGGVEIDARGVH